MFLYELAIELDRRSADLVDASVEMGMVGLGASSQLAEEQVAALRARFGTAPPTHAGPSGRAAEAMVWGPPSEDELPPPPPPAPPGTIEGGPAVWGAEVPPLPPLPKRRPDPGEAAEAVGSGPVEADGASAAAASGAPNLEAGAPLGGFGLEAEAVPAADLPEATPVPLDGTSTGRGMSRPQAAAVAAVVLLVVGLFGYMVMSTGKHPSQRDLDAQAAAVDAEIERNRSETTTTEATTTAPPTTAPATTTTTSPVTSEPRDLDRYCAGVRGVSAFELRMVAAQLDQDFPALQELVRDEAEPWSADVDEWVAGGPLDDVQVIEQYRSVYERYFAAVLASTNLDEVHGQVSPEEILALSTDLADVNRAAQLRCG